MNHAASIMVLLFLAITFIMSSYEKIFQWSETMVWLRGYFEKTFLKNYVPQAVVFLLLTELIAGVFCIAGIVQLFMNGGRIIGFYGAMVSCFSLLLMLVGQRLAKDYDGARNIVIYFIPAVLAVYWLG
ncbi:DoxX family protein [Flavobacterium sp. SUN046]|uniref:DoxX family protein n=1 Tax=Flavobacterium sp. SUN046 TaxID=3002440 RepID=UPI002DBC93B2|nr:DoxX family protein [Flavobacterium sp. SUN046]MEC4048158.1 DoxX family protein [Flavobacterium sp. SUN046]